MQSSFLISEIILSENIQLLFLLPDVDCFPSPLSSGMFVCLSVCLHLSSCSYGPQHQQENQKDLSSLDEIPVMNHTSEPGLDKPPPEHSVTLS